MITELTRDRFRRFRKTKRAWYSLILLGTAFFLSLFSEFIANDKPLLLRYNGGTYFPVVKFYPSSAFGGEYGTEPDYLKLGGDDTFKAAGGSMVFPILADSPLRTHLELEGNPPHAPSRQHLLGTDNSARDVLARLIYGFRICMAFALLLAFFDAALGITIGGLQGYLGGKVGSCA